MHFTATSQHPMSLERPGTCGIAITYLQEGGHRLISTANLDLEERGLGAFTALGRALGLRLVGIVPRLRPAENIVALLFRKCAARVDGLGDGEFVGASSAFEAVLGVFHDRNGQEVGAVGANCERRGQVSFRGVVSGRLARGANMLERLRTMEGRIQRSILAV